MIPMSLVNLVFLLTTAGIAVLGEVTINILANTESESSYLLRKPGTTIDIACRSSDGVPVFWLFKGVLLQEDERHLVQNLTDDWSVSQLTIVSAQLRDSGLYVCKDRRLKNSQSDQVTISIVTDDVDPFYIYHDLKVEIVSPLDSVLTVDTGGSFTLKCVGYRGANLSWYHNGSQLSTNHRIIITSSQGISDKRQISLLTRNSVPDLAAGSYECRDVVRSNLGDSVTVQVHRPTKTKVPVEIIQPPSKLDRVLVGSSFEIKCKANFSSDLVWFFNETQRLFDTKDTILIIGTFDRDAKLNTSTLRLTNATRRHSGKYSCRNLKDWKDNDSVMIIVDERDSGTPPMVPTSVIMQIGSVTNLQCSFHAPGDYLPEWTKDDQILLPGEKYTIHQDAKMFSLGIRFTDRTDVGVYKCTFKHISSNTTVGVVVFNVTTVLCPPLQPPSNGQFVRCPPLPVFGESCSFGCNHGYRLSNDTPIVCERRPENGEIYWNQATPECSAYETVLSEERVPTTVSNVLLRIGSSLRLQCSGSAVWTKHNRPLENSTKYTIEKNSLTINSIDRDDAGIYDCSIYQDQALIGMNSFNVTSLACPKPPALPHGDVELCREQPVFGEFCVFRCHAGYALHGSRLRSCELMGNENVPYWTGDQAECLGPAEPRVSSANSATSINIPVHRGIFEASSVVFRYDWLLTVVVTSLTMQLPHFVT